MAVYLQERKCNLTDQPVVFQLFPFPTAEKVYKLRNVTSDRTVCMCMCVCVCMCVRAVRQRKFMFQTHVTP